MDAKSKANFINSIVDNHKKPCPVCNALNDMDSIFCFSCGNKFMERENVDSQMEFSMQTTTTTNEISQQQVFTPVNMTMPSSNNDIIKEKTSVTTSVQSVFQSVPTAATIEIEEISVFAQGLPDWNVVPPQVMVRRKKK